MGLAPSYGGVRSADPKSKDLEMHNSGFQPTHGANTEQEEPELKQLHKNPYS